MASRSLRDLRGLPVGMSGPQRIQPASGVINNAAAPGKSMNRPSPPPGKTVGVSQARPTPQPIQSPYSTPMVRRPVRPRGGGSF